MFERPALATGTGYLSSFPGDKVNLTLYSDTSASMVQRGVVESRSVMVHLVSAPCTTASWRKYAWLDRVRSE